MDASEVEQVHKFVTDRATKTAIKKSSRITAVRNYNVLKDGTLEKARVAKKDAEVCKEMPVVTIADWDSFVPWTSKDESEFEWNPKRPDDSGAENVFKIRGANPIPITTTNEKFEHVIQFKPSPLEDNASVKSLPISEVSTVRGALAEKTLNKVKGKMIKTPRKAPSDCASFFEVEICKPERPASTVASSDYLLPRTRISKRIFEHLRSSRNHFFLQ